MGDQLKRLTVAVVGRSRIERELGSDAMPGSNRILTVTNQTPWASALWTATGGLIFGFLRAKSGAVGTPALLHGAILAPGVLFGGS